MEMCHSVFQSIRVTTSSVSYGTVLTDVTKTGKLTQQILMQNLRFATIIPIIFNLSVTETNFRIFVADNFRPGWG